MSKKFLIVGKMSEEFKKLVRTRTAAEGWVSRSAKALSLLLVESEVSKLKLEDVIADFDQRLHALDEAQTAVELEFCDTDKMEADIEKADQFRWQMRCCRLQAAQALADLMQRSEQPGESARSVSGLADSVLNNVKLPSIEFPKFSGDVLE